MTNIQTLYKVPIWIEDDLVSSTDLDYLENACESLAKNIPDYHHQYNPDTFKISRNSDISLLDHAEFEYITNLIKHRALLMMTDIGYSEDQRKKLKIDNAWFCMYRPGDSVQMHIHRPSFITAAFYIKNLTNCKLRFIHDMYKMSPYPKQVDNEWSKNSTDMECPAGRLLIFQSDCAHGTDQIQKLDYKNTDVVKIMLSYNFVLEC